MIKSALSRSVSSATFIVGISFYFLPFGVSGQAEKETKMKDLSFMIGDWVGTSTTYEKGEVKEQVPAFQKISFDLDSNIIVIELHSELLQLHTIIYYDEKEEQYSYNPYSRSGARQLTAELVDGRFVVNASETKRFIFGRTEKGFREYGEKLVDGKWEKYFEDNFVSTD
ncbi:MAG: hypothetical protein ACO2Z9_11340 [Crocinitomicaceae bacterium]